MLVIKIYKVVSEENMIKIKRGLKLFMEIF